MRKILVFLLGLQLLAVPAMAIIKDTKHDLSSLNVGDWGVGGGSDTTESCVFCHTPHGAGAAGFAPLWNRDTAEASSVVTAVYGDPSGTMDSVPTVANANASDATLCLSCHDGTITTTLTNPPNSGLTSVTATVGANATIGDDLSNDHPVAISYADGGPELETKADAETAGIVFYSQDIGGAAGVETDVIWCSSCHDVHDDTNAPFLIVSNAQSALCTSCHIK